MCKVRQPEGHCLRTQPSDCCYGASVWPDDQEVRGSPVRAEVHRAMPPEMDGCLRGDRWHRCKWLLQDVSEVLPLSSLRSESDEHRFHCTAAQCVLPPVPACCVRVSRRRQESVTQNHMYTEGSAWRIRRSSNRETHAKRLGLQPRRIPETHR